MFRARGRILTKSLSDRLNSVIKSAPAVLCALPLAACAVSSPLAISSTGEGAARGLSVTIEQPESASGLRGQFADALSAAFASQSVAVAKDSQLIADFSVSQAPAAAGVLSGKGDKPEIAPEDWIAQPREKRRFDECEAQRLRATLVLYDRTTSTMVYRGTGSATECDFSEADFAAMADSLVKDALSKSAR